MSDKIVLEGNLKFVQDFEWNELRINDSDIMNNLYSLGCKVKHSYPGHFVEDYGQVRITIERITVD